LEVILTIFIGSKLKTSEGLGQLQKSNPWAWLISCGDEGPSDADYRKDYEKIHKSRLFAPEIKGKEALLIHFRRCRRG